MGVIKSSVNTYQLFFTVSGGQRMTENVLGWAVNSEGVRNCDFVVVVYCY